MYKVLIIEHEPLLLWAIEKHLRKLGYVTSTSRTGAGALIMLRDRPVDIVVSDFPLPDMPGVTILEKIRHLHSSLPIIAITTSQLTSQEINHIEELVHTFLKKPFEIQRLEKLIKELLDP